MFLGRNGDTDHVVVLGQVNAAHAVGRPSHGADVVLVEADGLAQMRGQKDDLASVGNARLYQFVAVVDANGDNAARHDIAEVL